MGIDFKFVGVSVLSELADGLYEPDSGRAEELVQNRLSTSSAVGLRGSSFHREGARRREFIHRDQPGQESRL